MKKYKTNKMIHAQLVKTLHGARTELPPEDYELILKALFDKYYGWHSSCPCCGTTEMLCGYGGVGCVVEQERIGDYGDEEEGEENEL